MTETSLQNKKWIWEWERQAHLLIVSQLAKTYSQDKAWTWLLMPVLFVSHGQEVNLYFSSLVVKKSKLLAKRIQKDHTFLRDYKKKMSEEQKILTIFCKELASASIKKLFKIQLIRLLKKYGILYRQHGVTVIRTFNKVGPKIVEDFLRKKYSDKKITNWLPILFAATKESVEQKSEKDLLILVQQISTPKKLSDQKTKSLIQKYLKKYQWLPCGYTDEPPLKEKDIIKKIKLLLKEKISPKRKFSQLIKEQKDKIAQRTRLLHKLRLPKSILNLVEALSEFTFYKDYIRMNYNQLHFYSRPLFQEAAARLGITVLDIKFLTIPEIIKSLQKEKVDKRIISSRKKHYVCYPKGKRICVLTGKSAQQKEQETVRGYEDSQDILKGTSVFLGNVQGIVRIVKQVSQAKTFPKNAVLVTTMTTPDLVPIAKKAAAIVTDEGGLTCHAAIVSRELKIPCIVGTKIATKVLKDGDRVKVDTDEGIVRRF